MYVYVQRAVMQILIQYVHCSPPQTIRIKISDFLIAWMTMETLHVHCKSNELAWLSQLCWKMKSHPRGKRKQNLIKMMKIKTAVKSRSPIWLDFFPGNSIPLGWLILLPWWKEASFCAIYLSYFWCLFLHPRVVRNITGFNAQWVGKKRRNIYT